MGLYRRHPLLFTVLAVGVVAPYELIVLAITGKTPAGIQRGAVPAALTLTVIDFALVNPLIAATYVHTARIALSGGRPSFGEVLPRALRVLPTVAAAQIVATLGIAVGFLALIVPGVLMLLRWAVVAQVAAIENDNWIEALRGSARLTGGNYLHVLALLFVVGLIALAIRNAGLAAAGDRVQAQYVVVAIVAETIARALVSLCTAILFLDLVARRERVA